LCAGCGKAPTLNDGLTGSAGLVKTVGDAAGTTGDMVGGAASQAGTTAVGAANTAGTVAAGMTKDAAKTSSDVVNGVGAAANNVRVGAIDTFGVREVTTSDRFYAEDLKPVYVIPAEKTGQSAKDNEI